MLFRSFRRCHSLFNANWRNALAYALVSSRTSGLPRGVGLLSSYQKSRIASIRDIWRVLDKP
jgi:hypothetical protein